MRSEDLELLKRHCRIDDYVDPVEDAYLGHLYEAAVAVLVAETNRSEDELKQGGDDFPADFKHAAFMVAAHLHDNPESTTPASYVTDPYVAATIKKYERLSDREQ